MFKKEKELSLEHYGVFLFMPYCSIALFFSEFQSSAKVL